MLIDKNNVFTAVTADDIPKRTVLQGIYGYFAHDFDSLKKAVEQNKTSGRCCYGRLTQIRDATNRARFVLDRGDCIFSLFYPTDNYLNTSRY